jgi:hypothetical protein
MDRRSKPAYRTLSTGTAVLCLALLPGAAAPQDAEVQLQSEGMNVYGQSELPKVLYIVPWKRRQPGEIEMPASKSLASDVLEPIDPEIFRRQIRYHELILQSQRTPQP